MAELLGLAAWPLPLFRLSPGHRALRRSDLPVDPRLLSEAALMASLDGRLGALAAIQFALLCGPLAFVGGALPLVRQPLPHVRQPLPLVRRPIAPADTRLVFVRDLAALTRNVLPPSVGRLLAIPMGALPAGFCLLPASRLPTALKTRIGALASLPLPLFRRPLAFVGCKFPHVRQPLTLVRDPLALVRQPLTLVRQPIAPADSRLAFVESLSPLFTLLGHLLAPQGEPLTLGRKLLSLLGDVLALRGHSLAFPSHPNELVRLGHGTTRPARMDGNFSGSILVRTHP